MKDRAEELADELLDGHRWLVACGELLSMDGVRRVYQRHDLLALIRRHQAEELIRLRKANAAALTRESYYVDVIHKISVAMPKWLGTEGRAEDWHDFSMRLKKEAEGILAAHRKGYDAVREEGKP